MTKPRFRAAVVAGTGAGGSLGAAALCILVIGTAGVSYVFRGMPEIREPSPVVRLADPPPRPDRSPRKPSRPVVRQPVAEAPRARSAPAPERMRRATARRQRPVVVVRQRRARPVLPVAPAPPAPQPAPEPPPEPPPTLVRGYAEQAASEVRGAGSGTPAQPVTDAAADAVVRVATLLP